MTIVLPVSRPDWLPIVFAALELLECDREKTNLLVLVDGNANLFLTARNLTESSKFASRLCIQRKSDGNPRYDLRARRIRISTLHNEMKQHVPDCDYVWSIEDDGTFQPDALKRLLNVYMSYPFAGLVSGVEIGRHGLSHLGLWSVDDVYEPTTITSLMPGEGIRVPAKSGFDFLTCGDAARHAGDGRLLGGHGPGDDHEGS